MSSNRYLAAAFEEAVRLDDLSLSLEHFLLAVLREEESVAARVLRREGVTAEKVEADPRRDGIRKGGRHAGISGTIASTTVTAFADGLATGLGAPEVTAEHVLLALLWEPADDVFPGVGTSRDALLAALRAEGVEGADRDYPTTNRRRHGPVVDVPLARLMEVLHELEALLPPGASLAFNHDGERAWIAATEGVDLEPLIQVALAALDED